MQLQRHGGGLSLPINREDAQSVRAMFARIAHRYELMNRVMTAGQDSAWRAEVIRRAGAPAGGLLLDLGTGTGDLAREALWQCPLCRLIAADFTMRMMQVGRSRVYPKMLDDAHIDWNAADASSLPYANNKFDAVVSGFLVRNVSNIAVCLEEQYRVLRPGGRIVALDTTPPANSLLEPFVRVHLRYIIPVLGRLVTGQMDAYRYLPESTAAFLEPEQLASRLAEAGFRSVGYRRLMLGTIAIHWGYKPVVV